MQTSLFLLFGFLFAVSLGMVIIPRILVISHKKRLYDVPDARKVHTMPVPRLGGLSFFPVILMSMFLVIGFRLYFWDVNVSGLSFNMLYEYRIALSVLSVIFFLRGQYVYALLAICTLGILMPFWCYNVFGNANRGHKLFMGDAGSLTLGYVISFLIIHMSVTNEVSPTLSNPYMVIAFSTVLVPLLDVIRVVLHRLREHKNPFLPDKNHFHHKLLRTGMRVRMVMVCIIAISAFFILLNSSLAWRVDITYLFFLNLFCWSILHVGLNGLIKRNRERKESEQLR